MPDAPGRPPRTHLTADDLKTGLLGAGAYLRRNYAILDNLNVFPVPDGDTGTNMLVTFEAGLQAIGEAETVGEVAQLMSEPMTRQSRGNSGFILARFFHGFFEATDPAQHISRSHLAEGFSKGSYHVNTSLFSPVEGTMLTIIAAMAESLRSDDDPDLQEALERCLAAARAALFRTPKQLRILAKAGVVDSGGLGFIFLIEGFRRALENLDPADEREADYRFPPDPTADAAAETEPMHRYCTEILLRTNTEPPPDLGVFLKENGTSIALVTENGMLKVHIHTDDPEGVTEHLSSYGTVEQSKIDDMQEQMGLFAQEEDPDSVCTVISFVPGEGFRDLFVSLGIECAVVYGNELPSAADVLDAIESVRSRNLIILPNNKNILPTVMLARDRTDRNVSILPTGSVTEGLAAVYGYSENDTTSDNMANMNDCMTMVDAFAVYRSVAESVFDRTTIPQGAFFCVHAGHVVAVHEDAVAACLEAAASLEPESRTNACLYHSGGESLRSAEMLKDALLAGLPELEVEILFGGQPREYLIVTME